jgi:predicted  nucleic acid-binding Zn-ribbon protein
MTERDDRLQSLLARLEQERDELKLKIGLAKLESREEWTDLEGKLDRLRGRMKVVQEEAGESSGDVGAALEVLGEEIKAAFDRIRKVL